MNPSTDLQTGFELERHFISSLFNDPKCLISLKKEMPDFTTDYFTGKQHALIYNVIVNRVESGLPCELVDIAAVLQGEVRASELSEAVDYNPCLKDPIFYAKQIQEAYLKRTILKKLQGIIDDEGIPLEEITLLLKELIEEVPKPIQNNLNDSILSLDELLKMDIPERQKMLPWMPEGSLIMIYGPRGIGKTFLTLELIKSIACGIPFLKWEVLKPMGC